MRRKKIRQRPIPAQPHSLPSHLHPVLTRVYLSRGIRHPDELDRTLAALPPPWTLTGIDAMSARLTQALERGERILVVADYDADGATACALAVTGLHAMGARQVDFIVPDRFRLGYGLTPQLVKQILDHKPQVLVTVDNGIASLEGVAAAKTAGLDVLITDHHLPGERLPDADVIVDPNLPDDSFPSRALAGVGVMFYVLTALRTRLRAQDWFQRQGMAEPNLAELLDLVALGTVADVVPLDEVNRILVHQGLERMRAGRARPGVRALLEVAGRDPEGLVAADLGFALGPRLNAAGRLEDMSLGIRCLLSADLDEARSLARRLDTLNRERREIEARMQDDALEYLQSDKWDRGASSGVCLFDPTWHEGVIGILASRIKDRLGLPVIAFAQGEDGCLKGSARSIAGLHIRDLLSEIDAIRPGLIVRYGGHAMAAGLTLKSGDFDLFAELFAARVKAQLGESTPESVIHTDGPLQVADFSLRLATELRRGGPWGQGFPEPLFEGDFELLNARVVGERHLKMSLRPRGGPTLDGIVFGLDDPAKWLGCGALRMAYQLDINDFRGRRRLQLKAEYLEPIQ